jgi:exopolysaccharide production protein ExoQ
MVSSLALVGFAIFVAFLLRLDRKQFPEASLALWVPTIWMIFVIGRPIAFWFGGAFEDGDDGSAANRLFGMTCLLAGLYILRNRQIKWSAAIGGNPWVVIFLGYMLLSILWSDIPVISFKRWVRELVAPVMALVVATENDPRGALESLIRRNIYVLIPLSLLLVYFYPHIGTVVLKSGTVWWQGAAVLKNGLGRLCFFSLFFLIWSLCKRVQGSASVVPWYQKHVDFSVMVVALYLFMGPRHTLTYSATSTAALVLGLAVLGGLSWMKKRGKMMSSGILTLMIAGVLAYTLITPFAGRLVGYDVSEILDREDTVTGRADIWFWSIQDAMKAPVLGRGFGGSLMGRNPHNSPITIILNLGFVGFFLFSMFLLTSCSRARREMDGDFDWGALWICFLVMFISHGVAERSMVQFGLHLPAVLLFFYVSHNGASYRNNIEMRNTGSRHAVNAK